MLPVRGALQIWIPKADRRVARALSYAEGAPSSVFEGGS
jgi:hypothetical protein